ncbi:MAG TPA: GspH/FimT family pseudopilin [Thermoanaerobaculia bacterium]|jgi:prepilin-type N-terminal cleavage/methylation domain-containing protein|nr:GspH/FimT family pseudopilin [Thermoanaerobaculia bacterium]
MNQRGFSLAELLAVLALLGSLLAIAAPPLLRISGDLRVRLAAEELVGVLRLARAYAVRNSARVAVKFRTEKTGAVTFTLYRDGDGDGVLTRDIDKGVDPQVGPPRRLSNLGRGVGFGFPPGPPPTDPGSPGKPLTGLDDPIRFNQSDLASFDPLGTSTPGTLYFTDHQSRLAAVRVFNRTGKVRVLFYDPETRVWRD